MESDKARGKRRAVETVDVVRKKKRKTVPVVSERNVIVPESEVYSFCVYVCVRLCTIVYLCGIDWTIVNVFVAMCAFVCVCVRLCTFVYYCVRLCTFVCHRRSIMGCDENFLCNCVPMCTVVWVCVQLCTYYYPFL